MPELKALQVAVVTGGASGVGASLAAALVGRGLRVAIADIDAARLAETTERLSVAGGEVIGVPTDVSDAAAVGALRQKVLERFGRVDLVCLNAGRFETLAPVWTLDVARWRALFDVNFWSVVHGIREFVPVLLRQGSGHVLVTASMSGLCTTPESADYGSSKHAVVALAETLMADLRMAGASGIGVTILCPALVATPMGDLALRLYAASTSKGDRRVAGSGPELSNSLTPDEVADTGLRGVEEGQLYVLPHAGSRARILRRVQPLLDAAGES